MVRHIFSRGAAASVALFVLPIFSGVPELPAYVSPAVAKMRVERLSIQLAGGGPVRVFDVEMAESDKEKALGLMFRSHLSDDAGMLFWYPQPQDITMWMRNTYIPLDMVFIRPDGTIARIEAEAEPLSDRIIAAGAPVNAVLELAGGAAERLGIRPGDRVQHRLFASAQPVE
jgi:uncharacterized membrane protein (UPF0127 family)